MLLAFIMGLKEVEEEEVVVGGKKGKKKETL